MKGRGDSRTCRKGFFTDTTVCIGCKACEVACKQWNQLPDDGMFFTGMSYDNTVAAGRVHLAARRVRRAAGGARRTDAGSFSWLILSDVCKHCARAGCLESCPTGAIIRTEFDTVYVQPDICNGCGYCVVSCPFGVIDRPRGRRPRLEVHALLRPPEGRPGAGLRQGVSHRFDPVRRGGRAAREGRGARRRSCTSAACTEAYLYGADASQPARHRGPERVLPAGGQAGGLQPAARSGGADQASQGELDARWRWPRWDCWRRRWARWLRRGRHTMNDGRDIDASIATLEGEASRQQPSGGTRRGRRPPVDSGSWTPTYYDQPVLKPPVWIWSIPLTSSWAAWPARRMTLGLRRATVRRQTPAALR